MPTIFKAIGAIFGAIYCTYYAQTKLHHLPKPRDRKVARALLIGLSVALGLYFALDNRKHTYNSAEMHEVSIGYPFRIKSFVRYYDGFSEDSVSPFPNAVRIMNFLVGIGIIHCIGAIILYLMDLPDPSAVTPARKRPSSKPDGAAAPE